MRSRIVGGSTSRTWSDISWQATRPLLKNIPCNRTTESAYDASNYTMASSLLLLAHFDDSAWSGAGDVSDCAQSGSPNNGTANGQTVQSTNGKFGKAALFDGSSDYVEFANESNFDFAVTDSFTLAAWIKTTDTIATIIGKFDYTGTPRRGYNLLIEATGVITFDLFSSVSAPDNKLKKTDDRKVNDGNWHHVALTYDGSATGAGVKIYVDGSTSGGATVNFSTLTTAHEVRQDEPLRAGMSNWGSHSYAGLIDEVAIWSSELSPADIVSLYERGSDELRFQVRSCSDVTCSGNPAFIGPDGTSATFYDETLNSSLGLPSLGLTNLAANKYFQYLAIFKEDTRTASVPELSMVTVSPGDFNASSPSISTVIGRTYSSLNGFSETLGAGNQGLATYQLSNNGSSWYYHNGTTWASAATALHSNSAVNVDSTIGSFTSTVGTGTLYVKAFLNSNGSQQTKLDSVSVTYAP